MKKIILLLLLNTVVLKAQNTIDVVSTFYQGNANNCASVALIKSAMIKYGYKKMFICKESTSGFKITLKDGTSFLISKDEKAQAENLAKFTISDSRILGTEKDSVIKYAHLAYASIAKSIAMNGHYGCDEDNGRNYRIYNTYTDALKFISRTSFCTDYCLKLLGFKLKENKIYNYTNNTVTVPDGAILYSWGHAVVVLNNMLDCHGDWSPITTRRVCHNNFEWYVVPE